MIHGRLHIDSDGFRRELNLTFSVKIFIDDEAVTGADLREPAASLMVDDLVETLEYELAVPSERRAEVTQIGPSTNGRPL